MVVYELNYIWYTTTNDSCIIHNLEHLVPTLSVSDWTFQRYHLQPYQNGERADMILWFPPCTTQSADLSCHSKYLSLINGIIVILSTCKFAKRNDEYGSYCLIITEREDWAFSWNLGLFCPTGNYHVFKTRKSNGTTSL